MLRHLRGALSLIHPHLAAERARLAAYLSLLLVSTGLALVAPLALQHAVDDGLALGQVAVALGWIALGALTGVLVAALQSISGVLGSRLGSRVTEGVRCELYRHIIRLPYSFHCQSRSGAVNSRVTRDPVELQTLVQQLFGTFLGQGVSLICAAVVVGWSSPLTLLAVAVTVPLFLLPSRYWADRAFRAARDQSAAHAELQHFLGESIGENGSLTRELFATQEADAGRWARLAEISRGAVDRRNIAFHRSSFFVLAISGLCVFAVYALGALQGASVGQVVALAALVTLIHAPVVAMTTVGIGVSGGLAAAERIRELLDFAGPSDVGTKAPARPVTSLQFECVWFSHPTPGSATLADLAGDTGEATTEATIRDLSLELRAGLTTALAGPSGAGKTTTALLAAGILRPDQGRITLDGTALTDIDPDELHRIVGMVTQDAHLLHASLRDNLALAAPGATDAELVAALRIAQLGGLVDQLPQGLDTTLGDRGVRLSGGERQRLSLARVVLADPDIVIFDEATAHLDPDTENALHLAMSQQFAGRTQLVIAHRPGTIARADVVIRLEHGQLVDEVPGSLQTQEFS